MIRKLSPLTILVFCIAVRAPVRSQETTAEEDRWRIRHDNAAAALNQGRYEDAASLFVAAVQEAERFGAWDMRLAESLNGLAQVYRYQQNHAAAEPMARRSLAIFERAVGPSHRAVIPSLVNLAGVTAATGRYAEAERFYRRLLSLRWGAPGGVGADRVLENFAEVLALDLTRDPGLEGALEEYRRSVSDALLHQDLYVAMRNGFVAAKLMEEAETLMRLAVKAYPDSRQVRFELGELYAIWGKYREAIEAFESADRRGESADRETEDQRRGLIYERIGEMNLHLVRFEEAIAALTKALELDPENGSARLLLGAVYLRRNRLEEAAKQYSIAILANPRSASAHEGLAQVNLELGLHGESAKDAERALAIDPGLRTARYIKAMALIRGGNEQEGRTALQDYTRRENERRIAESRLNGLAELEKECSLLLADARVREAMTLLSEGIREYPLHARLYLSLGLIQSRLRLHREAADTFERMIRLQMDDFLVHRQLAREYDQLGNEEEGRRQRALYLQRYDAALQTKTR